MAIVNPDQSYADLGRTLAGGNSGEAAYREAQGEMLGANTQRAIAEANAQFAKNKALADPNLSAKLAAVNGGSPQLGDAITGLLQAGVNPEQTFSAIGTNQATGSHVTIADPNAPEKAREAAAQSLSPAGLANPLSDARQQFIAAQTQNVNGMLEPNQRLANAKAALAEAQAAHPELFHPGSTLNIPANPAELRALYTAGVIDPATANRASISGPAVHAAYLAMYPEDAAPAQPGAAPGAPAAPAAPGAAPSAAGPNPSAVLAPGGNAHAEIKSSDQQFASLKPTDPGGKIRAGNAISAHLGMLQQLHDAQANSDLPTAQRVFKLLTGQAGSDFPTMNALASHVVGDELNTFLVASGGAEAERAAMQGHFNQNNLGATQLQSNINEARNLMGGQFAALKKGYSTPTARSDAQVSNFGARFLLDPSILSDYEARNGAVTRGAAAAPAPPAAAPAAPGAVPQGPAPGVPHPAAVAAAPPGAVPGKTFATPEAAQEAFNRGIIKPGDKITVGGKSGTWH
jgi:hypothetical protein